MHRDVFRAAGGTRRYADTLGYAARLEGHTGCVNAIAFNANGRLLASGSDDTTVKVWDVAHRSCVETLHGSTSNVFAVAFMQGDRTIISAGNDGDVWLHQLDSRTSTVYHIHSRKALRVSVNPVMPDTFLSCAADGTVRMIDIRLHYRRLATTHSFADLDDSRQQQPQLVPEAEGVVPQAFGGGRVEQQTEVSTAETLIVRYAQGLHSRLVPALYSVDFHPTDGRTFIVGASEGNVRRFDLRMIREHDSSSYVNIYRNIELPCGMSQRVKEVTGCVFNNDGTKIVASCLNDGIYLFDADRNFENEGVDFFAPPQQQRRRRQEPSDRRRRLHFAESPIVPEAAVAAAAAAAVDETFSCGCCGERNFSGVRYKCLVCSDFELCHNCVLTRRETDRHRADHPTSIIAGRHSRSTSPAEPQRPMFGGVRLVVNPVQVVRILFDSLQERQPAEGGAPAHPVMGTDEGIRAANLMAETMGQLLSNAAAVLIPDGVTSSTSPEPAPPSVATPSAERVAASAPAERPCTFLQSYSGHRSSDTIKGCAFAGPQSEFVVSGSDDWRIFVWDRDTGALLRVLAGHEGVVNCVVQHPSDTLLASSGIDDYIMLWDASGDTPSSDVLANRERELSRIRATNSHATAGQGCVHQ